MIYAWNTQVYILDSLLFSTLSSGAHMLCISVHIWMGLVKESYKRT